MPKRPFWCIAEEIRQICLIDMAYGASDAATRIVIQAFADWQAHEKGRESWARRLYGLVSQLGGTFPFKAKQKGSLSKRMAKVSMRLLLSPWFGAPPPVRRRCRSFGRSRRPKSSPSPLPRPISSTAAQAGPKNTDPQTSVGGKTNFLDLFFGGGKWVL